VSSFLARARVTLGFVFGAIVLWFAEPTRETITIGVAIAIVGEGIRIWAAGHLNKAREVSASGPYSWVAHPLYLGSSVIGIGLAVASDRVVTAVLIATYLAVTLTAAIKTEEAFLRRTFGESYDRYRRTSATSMATENLRRFSVTRAIANREHHAVLGLAFAVLLLVLKATYNGVFRR
jgi:protein-S-isoprenylcysteine O-methyltransferase Ste14